MSFLNNVSVTTKHFILLSVMAIGFIVITAISHDSMGAIKKRLDIVYFGNIIPASKLMTISDMYNRLILNTVHQYQNTLINASQAKSHILNAKEVIVDSWHEYTSKYHTKQEGAINEYAELKINESIKVIDLLIYFFEQDDKMAIEKVVKSELYSKVNPVIDIIDKLIAYEFLLASYEKRTANEVYLDTKTILLFTLLITFFLAAAIFYPIVKNIQNSDTALRYLNKKLTAISITDPLTQIYNRRYLDIIVPKEILKTRRKKESLCFAMIDIDYFKLYNDNYGHQAGDEALKKTANAIKKCLKRAGDYTFRFGGEEFAVLVSDMKKKDAEIFFENIKNSIKNLKIEHIKNSSGVITISTGVTFLNPDESVDMHSLIKKSDEYLYQAKESGRNIVILGELI